MQTTSGSVDLIKIATARRLAATGEARRLRVAHRISGPEMAHAVGVGAATLWRWEQGQRQPQGDAAARWADILDDLASSLGGDAA